VDAGHMGAAPGHAFGEQAATATDVQYTLAGQRRALVNVVKPQRVDVVQRAELAGRIPPAAGEGFELGDFVVIYILVAHGPASACVELLQLLRIRSDHAPTRSIRSGTSIRVSLPSCTWGTPPIQLWLTWRP